MANRIKFESKIDIKDLEKLNKNTDDVMEEVLLAGVNVSTDILRSETEALKVTRNFYAKPGQKRFASKNEKQGLLDNLGFTPASERGGKLNRKSGFDGYNKRGVANPKIANFINTGAGFQTKQPFISRATRKSKSESLAKMDAKLEEEIKKYIK